MILSEYKGRVKEWPFNDITLKTPTFFPRIKNYNEMELFKNLVRKHNLNYIGGYVVNLNKLNDVFKFKQQDIDSFIGDKLRSPILKDKIFILDPLFDKIFSLDTSEIKHFSSIRHYFSVEDKIFSKLSNAASLIKNRDKVGRLLRKQRSLNQLEDETLKFEYEKISSSIGRYRVKEGDISMNFFENLFELETNFHTSILTIPTLPLEFRANFEKVFSTSADAMELARVFHPNEKKMLLLNINRNILTAGVVISRKKGESNDNRNDKKLNQFSEINKEKFKEIEEELPKRKDLWYSWLSPLIDLNPDLFGIKLINFQWSKPDIILLVYFTSFLRDLIGEKYLHYFDMDETFYALYSRGADSYSYPIATSPKYGRSKEIRLEGKKYHYKDKLFYYFDHYFERYNDDQIPCPCSVCDAQQGGYGTFLKIIEDARVEAKKTGKKYITIFRKIWNEYRKRCYILVKNIEMKELQEEDDPRLIGDKLANSERQDLYSFFK